ncbi:MAG: competence/damage-inducible protein A [Burkholderiales bacterium 66-5]|nr:MAG: competence/damage-inducible protein A [Burkholderiales bacterium 66-5]
MIPAFGLILVGDEILSGKRVDKHLPTVIRLLAERGLSLSWMELVGDDRARITAALTRAFAGRDVVFSCGGIGATPDDHTRQCAAAALGVPLLPHPEAQALITERMQDVAREKGEVFAPDRPDNLHRLQMGVLPRGARTIPNPYNKIPGFSCTGAGGAQVHFAPGFPVMAWPMIEWVLDTSCAQWFHRAPQAEHSIVLHDAPESLLTPLMQQIEAEHPGIKVFSLPSVDHPVHGAHLELGVKGAADRVPAAWQALVAGLQRLSVRLGPEIERGH